jgi:hypothetical protein
MKPARAGMQARPDGIVLLLQPDRLIDSRWSDKILFLAVRLIYNDP